MYRCAVCRKTILSYEIAWTIVALRNGEIYDTFRLCKPHDNCVLYFNPAIEPDDQCIITRWDDSGMQLSTVQMLYSEFAKLINNWRDTKSNNPSPHA